MLVVYRIVVLVDSDVKVVKMALLRRLRRICTRNAYVSCVAWSHKVHSSAKLSSLKSLIYSAHGDPSKVVERVDSAVISSRLKDNEVLIRMLAAPINPADMNMIQGVYPLLPKLPAVGGNEGVGEVMQVGKAVTELQAGDWVVPAAAGWGTWRMVAVCPSTEVMKIPNDISIVSGATILVNPSTAYRMLADFVNLSPGDCIIQNGANSGVGQAVIQLAAQMSLHTINVIRVGRPGHDQLVKYLKELGATYVVTDEYLKSKEMTDLVKSLPSGAPRLALNCVGGRNFVDLLKHVAFRGVAVTYGGMAKQPLYVSAGPLIFNDVKLCGFWNSRWISENRGSDSAKNMWNYIADSMRSGHLREPLHRLVPMEDFTKAIERSMEPFVTEKQILILNEHFSQK